MSEEIKDIILDVKDSLNETPKNMYKYSKITLNLNEFEEILNYEIYKAGKEGKNELQLPLEELEEAIDFSIRIIVDGEIENDGIIYKKENK